MRKASKMLPGMREIDYQPGPCRECGSVNTREVANYLTACYTLIYCVDCGHKVHADGKTPKDSQERCRRLWEREDLDPYEDDVEEEMKQHSGLLEE